MQQKFNVVIEQDSEGWLVASVPAIPGCHSQGRTFDELALRIREALSLFVDETDGCPRDLSFGFNP